MLSPPTPTIKYDTFIFNPDLQKYHYIKIGFKEVSIGQVPEKIVFYDDLKLIRRQYGLRHYVTGTIHDAMGDTYNRIAILVSDTERLCSLWDRCQLIVVFSRTRILKNTLFVGPNNEIIRGLKLPLNQRTRWFYYIEEVIKIENVNPNKIMNLQLLLINPAFHFEFVVYHYHKINLGLFIV